jgi:hypothetical protein
MCGWPTQPLRSVSAGLGTTLCGGNGFSHPATEPRDTLRAPNGR